MIKQEGSWFRYKYKEEEQEIHNGMRELMIQQEGSWFRYKDKEQGNMGTQQLYLVSIVYNIFNGIVKRSSLIC